MAAVCLDCLIYFIHKGFGSGIETTLTEESTTLLHQIETGAAS